FDGGSHYDRVPSVRQHPTGDHWIRLSSMQQRCTFFPPPSRADVVSADFHDLWTWPSRISRRALDRRAGGISAELPTSIAPSSNGQPFFLTWRNKVTSVSLFNIVIARF